MHEKNIIHTNQGSLRFTSLDSMFSLVTMKAFPLGPL